MMMFLVGCQNAHESNSKTNTKNVINQETKTNADKKDGETKDVEKQQSTNNQSKVNTNSNEQSSSKPTPIESEVDKKPNNKPSQNSNNSSPVEPPVPDSPQEKLESNPSEKEPTPAPPVCNDAIPQGAFRTEQEAASYAQGVLMDNMLNGDGSLSGYELEWLQTECGTTYYTVKIY